MARMIWDDPWVVCAKQKGGTRLPPPTTPLAADQRFVCVRVTDLHLAAWADLVGTRWTSEELVLRLEDAWIPCLFRQEELVATCVLRPRPEDFWLLETLRARTGFGTPLLRAVIPWLWARMEGFVLGYTWELSLPGLMGAWWRGWLGSATALQYGWAWTDTSGCGFCPTAWQPLGPRLALPTLFQDVSGAAVVSDSGLGDGWGYVSVFRGQPDWLAIAARGGWRSLWMRAVTEPKGWTWTGEFIVVGLLNYREEQLPCLDWSTAEIASG